jgi:hypothetical protein
MRESLWGTFVFALMALPEILDRATRTTAPYAVAAAGLPAEIVFAGLAILSAQLWRLRAGLIEPPAMQDSYGYSFEAPGKEEAPTRRGRHLLLATLLGCLTFGFVQIMPVNRTSNPAIHAGHTIEASLNPPPEVNEILKEACKDCHSHETHWPWYAKIAPVSWILARDIERARHAVNFSEWPAQPGAKPTTAIGYLVAACADAETQRMPPAAYRWMHPQARLAPEKVALLCDWTAAQTRLLRSQAKRQKAVVASAR